MDNAEPTAGRRQLDRAPAASGPPDAVDVLQQTAVALAKLPADQLVDGGDQVGDGGPLVATARDRAVRDALLLVLRALDLGDLGPELLGTLRPLTYHGADYAPAVLRSLGALVAGR